jgi:hypothetical protein
MADFGKDYKVPKVQEQMMKVPGKKGGNTDTLMPNPPPKGAARNPGASPDKMFGREFSAEKDLATLIGAAKIRASKARYGAAMSFGKAKMVKDAKGSDRAPSQNVSVKNAGGSFTEKKGANNAGVRTKSVNSFDNVKGATKPNSGQKMDGGKGRW